LCKSWTGFADLEHEANFLSFIDDVVLVYFSYIEIVGVYPFGDVTSRQEFFKTNLQGICGVSPFAKRVEEPHVENND
jgi:hypothetical protein